MQAMAKKRFNMSSPKHKIGTKGMMDKMSRKMAEQEFCPNPVGDVLGRKKSIAIVCGIDVDNVSRELSQ